MVSPSKYRRIVGKMTVPAPDQAGVELSMLLQSKPCQDAMKNLTPRQKSFVIAVALGNMSLTECAARSGYAQGSAAVCANKLLKREPIQQAVKKLEVELGFIHGIPLRMKRQKLWSIAEAQEQQNPGVAVSSIKLLSELDGNIKTGSGHGSGGVQIVITGLLGFQTSIKPVSDQQSDAIEGECEAE